MFEFYMYAAGGYAELEYNTWDYFAADLRLLLRYPVTGEAQVEQIHRLALICLCNGAKSRGE